MERFTQRSNKGKAVCRCKTAYSLVHCTEIVGGEAIEYFAELEDKLESGQLKEIQQIAEAFNKAMANEQTLVTVPSNEEEIVKRVAKEILQELDSRYWGDIDTNADICGAEHNQTIRSLKKWVQRKYGVEINK